MAAAIGDGAMTVQNAMFWLPLHTSQVGINT
jgi:hypothetical protein